VSNAANACSRPSRHVLRYPRTEAPVVVDIVTAAEDPPNGEQRCDEKGRSSKTAGGRGRAVVADRRRWRDSLRSRCPVIRALRASSLKASRARPSLDGLRRSTAALRGRYCSQGSRVTSGCTVSCQRIVSVSIRRSADSAQACESTMKAIVQTRRRSRGVWSGPRMKAIAPISAMPAPRKLAFRSFAGSTTSHLRAPTPPPRLRGASPASRCLPAGSRARARSADLSDRCWVSHCAVERAGDSPACSRRSCRRPLGPGWRF
jgi:hypothetical protein